MKMQAFAIRNTKEILRDPLSMIFSLGFPLVLLLLLTAIQANIPVGLFEIQKLTPGIAIFGLSFMTLFCATLVSKDRESALLQRLYTTPLSSADFIFGYVLPVIPIAAAQSFICYFAAVILGLPLKINILYAIVMIIPISVLYISLGLLCGSVLNVKQVSGICGALFINLSAWLSDTWFDLDLVGGAFRRIAYALPFVHAVELERTLLNQNYSQLFSHLLWVLGYAAVTTVFAVLLFLRQMKKQ
ncbi:MAG: ABC transporter permease [Candidatus Limiplasma sp.]|nr:ABC transporter permease [Candidatus Limiplasma sp.]